MRSFPFSDIAIEAPRQRSQGEPEVGSVFGLVPPCPDHALAHVKRKHSETKFQFCFTHTPLYTHRLVSLILNNGDTGMSSSFQLEEPVLLIFSMVSHCPMILVA